MHHTHNSTHYSTEIWQQEHQNKKHQTCITYDSYKEKVVKNRITMHSQTISNQQIFVTNGNEYKLSALKPWCPQVTACLTALMLLFGRQRGTETAKNTCQLSQGSFRMRKSTEQQQSTGSPIKQPFKLWMCITAREDSVCKTTKSWLPTKDQLSLNTSTWQHGNFFQQQHKMVTTNVSKGHY